MAEKLLNIFLAIGRFGDTICIPQLFDINHIQKGEATMAKKVTNGSTKTSSTFKPADVVSKLSAAVSKKTAPSCDALKAEIGQKAKEIWEKKGRQQGKDVENWVEAESIIKKKYGIR
jgi:hypothetical protein